MPTPSPTPLIIAISQGSSGTDPAVLIAIAVITASGSFLAAVVAVLVGQFLSRRFQQSADKSKWKREDATRRRTRSEEMARVAIEELAVATDRAGWTAGYRRGKEAGEENTYAEVDDDEMSLLVRPVRRAALEIDNDEIRRHLEKACDLLVNGGAARGMGAPHPARAAYAVQQTSEQLISGYLRDVPIPVPYPPEYRRPLQTFNDAYSALEELWAQYAEDYPEDERE